MEISAAAAGLHWTAQHTLDIIVIDSFWQADESCCHRVWNPSTLQTGYFPRQLTHPRLGLGWAGLDGLPWTGGAVGLWLGGLGLKGGAFLGPSLSLCRRVNCHGHG